MDLSLQADQIVWTADAATATGHVVVVSAEWRLEGEAATWQNGVLHLQNGRLIRADGVFEFEQAELQLDPESVEVHQATVQVEDATLQAGVLSLRPETWQAQDAQLAPCACTDGKAALLTFSARELEVRDQKWVILHGGRVQVFDVAVLPVPWARIGLDPDRFRLNLPQVSYGSQGWAASVKAQKGFGDWDFSAGPAWRQDRGLRGQFAVTGPLKLQAEGGWDTPTQSLRGGLDSSGGFAAPPYRLGWQGEWLSDPAYAEDYGLDWVARGVAWREQRAVAAVGPLQLNIWDADTAQPDIALLAQTRLGHSLFLGPSAQVLYQEGQLGTGVALTAGGGHTEGPVHAAFLGQSVGLWMQETGLEGTLSGQAQVDLSFWGEHQDWRAIWWPGLRLKGDLHPEATGGALGPGVDLRLGGPTGSLSMNSALFWSPSGWQPQLRLDLGIAQASASLDLQSGQQTAGLHWDSPTLGLGLNSMRVTPDLWLASATARTLIRRWVVGGSLAYDVVGGRFSGAGLQSGYDDGCTALLINAAISPDRLLPDFGAQLRLRK